MSRGTLRAALVILAISGSLSPLGSAAPYLQAGANAARTGLTNDPGPANDDTAFQVSLPGRLAGTPLIFDGSIFVATFASPWNDDAAANVNRSGLWRIDLATAQATLLARFESPTVRVSGLASDGRLLFTNVGNEFRAYEASSGALAWAYVHQNRDLVASADVICRDAAVDNGTVFAVCYESGARAFPSTGTWVDAPPVHQNALFAIALEAATGRFRWQWTQDATAWLDAEPSADSPLSEPAGWPGGIAVVDGLPYVVTMNPTKVLVGQDNPGGYSAHGTVWALDANGRPRWHWGENVGPRGPTYGISFYNFPLAGDAERILVGSYDLMVIDPATGTPTLGPTLQEPQGAQGQATGYPWAMGMPLAMQNEAFWVGTWSSLYRVEPSTLRTTWRADLTSSPLSPMPDERSTVLVTHDRVYIDAHPGTRFHPASFLVSVNKEGTVAWRSEMAETSAEASKDVPGDETNGLASAAQAERHLTTGNFAIGEAVLAYVTSDGQVRVFGRTAASLAPHLVASSVHPAPGETVSVDLSATKAGAMGPASEYRVVWGDGAEAPWQSGARFEHAYLTAGDVTATVHARNEAGQSASESFTFHVGGRRTETPTGLAAFMSEANVGVPWFVLVAVLLLVVATVLVRGLRRGAASAVLAPEDRTEAYRAALERAVDEMGNIPSPMESVLAALRGKLGLTERDHAVLLAGVRAQRGKGGLVLRPGATVLGKYKVLRELGAGGQGAVYLAADTLLDREVVVKILSGDSGDQAVILREARTLAALRHPNVVTVYDVDRVGDVVFVVMERVEGGSLADRLARGPLPSDGFLDLANDLLSALSAVHDAGMLHLDVKPANVLLTHDGRAKLADFGIAQRPGLVETVAATSVAQGSGTLSYMAPEQARQQAPTRKSDLFAAGLVLFEAWTGHPYFGAKPGEGAFELRARVAAAPPFRAAMRGPEPLRAWFRRALHPDPGSRHESASAMLDALPTEVLVPRSTSR